MASREKEMLKIEQGSNLEPRASDSLHQSHLAVLGNFLGSFRYSSKLRQPKLLPERVRSRWHTPVVKTVTFCPNVVTFALIHNLLLANLYPTFIQLFREFHALIPMTGQLISMFAINRRKRLKGWVF